MGPVYVNLDVGMQEAPLRRAAAAARRRHASSRRWRRCCPIRTLLTQAATLLRDAQRPVILFGRGSRRDDHWANRVALAEALGARVLTDLKLAAAFPTDHPLHAGAPATFQGTEATQALAAADVVLSLDWVDLAGTLRSAGGARRR